MDKYKAKRIRNGFYIYRGYEIHINCDNINEKAFYYFEDGQHLSKYDNNINDLMMLPEKKEGWVNVYKGIDGVTFSTHPYTSKDEAIKKSGILSSRIDTIKVSWEE